MASSPSADPSSSPTPADAAAKHAWSQIARPKDAASFSKKLPPAATPDQIPTLAKEPQTNQVRGRLHTNAELGITPAELSLDDDVASVADARVFDEASVKCVDAVEASKTVVDGNAVTADGSEASQNNPPESSHGDVADSRVSRPPWRKPPMATEGDIKPQPVMGATAWPALADARNMKKTSETKKSKVSSLKTPHQAAGASIQEPLSKLSLHSGDGSTYQGVKNKPSFKGAPVGIGRPAFQPIENGASFLEHPAMGVHGGPEESLKHNSHARMKGNFSANPSMDNDRVHHHRNDGAGTFHNNNRKWRNNHRDQARGWPYHGRAYENAGDMAALLHEQRIGPRNMPRHQHFMNMNPGFYPIPHFQNGGMYYIPPGAPEFVHGPPYFPPIAPPGGMIGPDHFSLRSMLIKQVDYYFSVENLCRDVYLRTHMDEEGFVPVSVIAQFNRIRSLSSNPMVIVEALQHSAVVEVQHDRIRRRNDRGKWRLIRDQVNLVNRVQESISIGNTTERDSEQAHDGGSAISLEEPNTGSAPERAGGGGSVVSSEEVNNGSAEALDMPQADAECCLSPSDRFNGSGDCVKLEAENEHDDINSAKTQHINMLGTDASTQSFSPRDVNTKETAVCSTSVNDSAGCQGSDSTTLQDGPENTLRNQVAFNQKSSFSDARFLEKRGMALQAAVDGKPVCWRAPEGFWMENSAYLMRGGFEQDGIQPRESDFVLKMHEDGNEHHGEGSDRELDRLINVSRTSLGSFIAVP